MPDRKVLIIQTSTKHRSSTIVFYYTILFFSSVQTSHHQGDVGYTEEYIFCVSHKKTNIDYQNCMVCLVGELISYEL